MSREADYTLKGFIYQFNKTLEELLINPEGTDVTVEGIIEDIDVKSIGASKAIQCKYHEAKVNFTLSSVFKPILQMMTHYAENQNKNIQYILYSFFPNEAQGDKKLVKSDIEEILKTKDKKLVVNYISKLIPPKNAQIEALLTKQRKSAQDTTEIVNYYSTTKNLDLIITIDDFLNANKFKFVIGKPFDKLVVDIKNLLEKNSSFSQNDIEDLFYPNAIQMIADKSIIHDSTGKARIVEKADFIKTLESLKKTVISRWTKELSTYQKLLKKRREQLHNNLQSNHRLRYFIFNSNTVKYFEDEIVNFIVDYLGKYNCKIKLHSHTPAFCIYTSDTNLIANIESRLHSKEVRFVNGFKGKDFFQNDFLRKPERIIPKNWCEFHLRIGEYSSDIINCLNIKKCDDMFIIGRVDTKELDLQDVNAEYIDVVNINELRYLIKLSDTIN